MTVGLYDCGNNKDHKTVLDQLGHPAPRSAYVAAWEPGCGRRLLETACLTLIMYVIDAPLSLVAFTRVAEHVLMWMCRDSLALECTCRPTASHRQPLSTKTPLLLPGDNLTSVCEGGLGWRMATGGV
jgi:hypothetical protein